MLDIQRNGVTYHVTAGLPPRRFSVTFAKGSKTVLIESERRRRTLRWDGNSYRPGSDQQVAAAIEKFLELEAQPTMHGRPIEEINQELLHPQVNRKRKPQSDSHERQLPAGDRA